MSSQWAAQTGAVDRDRGRGSDPAAEFMMFSIPDPGEIWFRRLRIAAGIGAMALGAIWADAINIRVGLGVVLAAVLTLTDALYPKEIVAFTGLWRDSVLVLAAMLAVRPPVWAVLGPWALLVGISFLRLPPPRAVRFTATVSGFAVALCVFLGFQNPTDEQVTAGWLILLASLAVLVLGVIIGIAAHYARERQRARKGSLEGALEACSESLLGGNGTMEDALGALLPATGAQSVIVRRNVDDAELGSVMRLVAETHSADSPSVANRQRSLVPWAWFDEKKHVLAHGRECVIRRDALTGAARQLYEEAGVQVELDFPIFVHGAWAGHIAFTELERRRMDDVQERSMLRAAAYVIGEYWERQTDRGRHR